MMRSGLRGVNVVGLRGLRVVADDLCELLFPTQCLGCDSRGSWFCAGCDERSRLKRGLDHCLLCNRLVRRAGSLCTRHQATTGLTGIQSYGSYREAPLRQAIHWLKYRGIWRAVPRLAAVAQPRLEPILAMPWDVVTPIPLNNRRHRERGFNQAELLARLLFQNNARTPQPDLVRTRDTEHQTRLGRSARRENVQDAFQWIGKPLRGKALLIDDVVTTGATLGAAARALRTAGAHEVWAVTLAYDPLVR